MYLTPLAKRSIGAKNKCPGSAYLPDQTQGYPVLPRSTVVGGRSGETDPSIVFDIPDPDSQFSTLSTVKTNLPFLEFYFYFVSFGEVGMN